METQEWTESTAYILQILKLREILWFLVSPETVSAEGKTADNFIHSSITIFFAHFSYFYHFAGGNIQEQGQSKISKDSCGGLALYEIMNSVYYSDNHHVFLL